MKKILLAGVAVLLLGTGAVYAETKEQAWKSLQGTYCIEDDSGLVDPPKNSCDDADTVAIGDKAYSWQDGEYLRLCTYKSVKGYLDKTIPASTKTLGVWAFDVVGDCTHQLLQRSQERFKIYMSQGVIHIERKYRQ